MRIQGSQPTSCCISPWVGLRGVGHIDLPGVLLAPILNLKDCSSSAPSLLPLSCLSTAYKPSLWVGMSPVALLLSTPMTSSCELRSFCGLIVLLQESKAGWLKAGGLLVSLFLVQDPLECRVVMLGQHKTYNQHFPTSPKMGILCYSQSVLGSCHTS